MIAICRDHAANVKRWRDGQMALRWIAAGMGEAAKQFRRVNGYLHLPALRAALDATITAVTPSKKGGRRLITPGRHRSSTAVGTSSRWCPYYEKKAYCLASSIATHDRRRCNDGSQGKVRRRSPSNQQPKGGNENSHVSSSYAAC